MAGGGYDETLRIAADFDLWSRLLRAGAVLQSLPAAGVAIRAHETSVTALNKGRGDIPEVCRIIGANIKRFSSVDLNETQLRNWWAFVYAPQTLTAADFAGTDALMGDIYGRINVAAEAFLTRQRKIFFINALFALCGTKAALSPGQLCRCFISRHGFWSFYGWCWLLTMGGCLSGLWAFIHDIFRKLQPFSIVKTGPEALQDA